MKLKHYSMAAAVITAGAIFLGASPAHAAGKLCKVHLTANDLMKYSTKSITVGPGCSQIEVSLTNVGKLPKNVMGHDWVLTKKGDLTAVANAGLAAGLANNYQKPNDPRIIASTKLAGGGQTVSVTFPASKLTPGGAYVFFCTFPGHDALMRGTFTYR